MIPAYFPEANTVFGPPGAKFTMTTKTKKTGRAAAAWEIPIGEAYGLSFSESDVTRIFKKLSELRWVPREFVGAVIQLAGFKVVPRRSKKRAQMAVVVRITRVGDGVCDVSAKLLGSTNDEQVRKHAAFVFAAAERVFFHGAGAKKQTAARK